MSAAARRFGPRAGCAALVLVFLALCAGCRSTPVARDFTLLRARFFLEAVGTAGGTPVRLPQSGVGLELNPKPVLTEGDIVNVELVQVDLGRCLMFQLTPSALRDFYRLTGSHQGRRLVLLVNDVALGARRIDGAIANGVLYIFVEAPDAELPELAANLKKSALAWQEELRRKG